MLRITFSYFHFPYSYNPHPCFTFTTIVTIINHSVNQTKFIRASLFLCLKYIMITIFKVNVFPLFCSLGTRTLNAPSRRKCLFTELTNWCTTLSLFTLSSAKSQPRKLETKGCSKKSKLEETSTQDKVVLYSYEHFLFTYSREHKLLSTIIWS